MYRHSVSYLHVCVTVCFVALVITVVKIRVPDWQLKHGLIFSSSPLTLLKVMLMCVEVHLYV